MSTYTPQLDTEQIYVETSEYAIVGTITLPAVQRVSDALNNRDRDFIPLADAISVSKADGTQAKHSFLAVSRTHIVIAFSLAEEGLLDAPKGSEGVAAFLRDRSIRARLNADQPNLST